MDEVAPARYIVTDDPPSWMPQLREIAARLGVLPYSENDPKVLLAVGQPDELYDVGAMLLAFLDRAGVAVIERWGDD